MGLDILLINISNMSNSNNTSIERTAEVYEKYIVDQNKLDYDFDDDVIGVTMCEIKWITHEFSSYKMVLLTPWDYICYKSEDQENVVGKESSFIYQVSEELDISLSSYNDIMGKRIPILIKNIYPEVEKDKSDVSIVYEIDINPVIELDFDMLNKKIEYNE